MLGYRFFRNREPNRGHVAAASLERMGILGVHFPDSTDFYDDNDVQREGSAATRSIAVVTQNVDSLHQRAGSRRVLELHGRADVVRCGRCGAASSRNEFHDDLERVNADWLASALRQIEAEEAVEKDQNAEPQRDGSALRPDGDAHLRDADYSHLYIPSCDRCGVGFLKPDVVFFGDSVPRQRVAMCSAAVEACDGLLVAGTSLAVQSAYRHVRTASHRGVPICILNVGETRAEVDGLPGILKVEAPIGLTLAGVAAYYESQAKTVAS
jgi:NAD-dependent SIR2 family protein deacetylase